MSGCSYVNSVDGYTFPADSTYIKVDYLLNDLREPISDAFDLTVTQEADMDFMKLYKYCDVI